MNETRRSRRRERRHESGSRGPAVASGLLLIALGIGLIAVNSFGMDLPIQTRKR